MQLSLFFKIYKLSFRNYLTKLVQYVYNTGKYTYAYRYTHIHIQKSSLKEFFSKIKLYLPPLKEPTITDPVLFTYTKKMYDMDKALLITLIVLK